MRMLLGLKIQYGRHVTAVETQIQRFGREHNIETFRGCLRYYLRGKHNAENLHMLRKTSPVCYDKVVSTFLASILYD